MRRPEQWLKLSVIGAEYFPAESAYIRQAIGRYWRSNKKGANGVMPAHALRLLVKDTAGRNWKVTAPILKRVLDAGTEQAPLVEAQVKRYIEREGLRRVALEIASDFDKGRYGQLDARAVSKRVSTLCLDVTARNTGGRLGGAINYREHLEVGRISSGLPQLDYALSGGFGRGELAVVIGAWGGGKTTFLVQLGANAAASGAAVLHISAEIPYWQVSCRYEQCTTGKVFEEVVGLKRHVGVQRLPGMVHVEDYSHMRITPAMLEELCVEHLPLGKQPCILVMDYLALCKLDGISSDGPGRRFEVGELFREARRIGNKLEIPVLTAHQATREASRSGEFGGNDVSEDISIMHTVDTALCVNQNPVEKRRKRGWVVIEKVRIPRSNANRMIEAEVDYDRQRIREVQPKEK